MAQVHLTTKGRRARAGRCSSKSCATEPVKNSSKPPGTASIMETNAAGAVGAEAEEDDAAAGRFFATCTAGTSDADEPAEVAAVGAEAVADIDAAGRFSTLLAGVTKCRVVFQVARLRVQLTGATWECGCLLAGGRSFGPKCRSCQSARWPFSEPGDL